MADVGTRATELHRQAIVIDGHSDILMPVTDGKMRLGNRVEVPDPMTWQAPMRVGDDNHFGFPQHAHYFGPAGQYDIPRFREGGITAQVCAIYLDDHQLDAGLKRGLEMTWEFHQAIKENAGFELITSAADIRRLKQNNQCGAILSFEGFEPLGAELRFLDLYYQLGLRIASLTHVRRNLYADGCYAADSSGGLTSLGKQAVKRMNELGIVIDLVHINWTGYGEVLELTTDPLILSHSTSTMFPTEDPHDTGPLGKAPRPRLIAKRDRPMLEALARNGGVLGIIWFYQRDLDAVVADIETALDLIGPDHIGLGSDLYGLELAPQGLEDISKVPALTRRLVERGHSDETILKFLGGNYLRVFEHVWKG
ncbi:MAG: membrane dipeptidase [Anaerolineae bacterium]